jgi:hypothetical protein
VAKFISSTSRTGNYLVRFRCVEERDKSFAMGIAMTVFGTFGSIPYPLIFGAIADSACLIWEESCGGKGNCWLYDSEKFRQYLHGAAFTFMTIGSFFDMFVIYFSKNMKNLYDDEEDVEGDTSRSRVTDGGGHHLPLQDLSSHHRKDANDNDDQREKYEMQSTTQTSSRASPEASTAAQGDQDDSQADPLELPHEEKTPNQSSSL